LAGVPVWAGPLAGAAPEGGEEKGAPPEGVPVVEADVVDEAGVVALPDVGAFRLAAIGDGAAYGWAGVGQAPEGEGVAYGVP